MAWSSSLRALFSGVMLLVVLANGCFDVLHPGHVSYLEEAARCGEDQNAGVAEVRGEELQQVQ